MTLTTGRPPLTYRQREVLSLAAQGLTNRAIAARLATTEEGVKSTMRKALDKLGAVNRVAAVVAAGEAGLLLPAAELPGHPLVRVHTKPRRVAVTDLRDVVARWDGRAPAGLVDELRALLGDAG